MSATNPTIRSINFYLVCLSISLRGRKSCRKISHFPIAKETESVLCKIQTEKSKNFVSLQECPEGVVLEEAFKDVYQKFFPHGSKYNLIYTVYQNLEPFWSIFFLIFSDSSLYAHYVFKAFDVNCNGAITFRVSQWKFPFSHFLSLRGFLREKVFPRKTRLSEHVRLETFLEFKKKKNGTAEVAKTKTII